MNEISKEMVCRIGEHSETSEYFPEKVNTQILNVLDRTNIQIEIYERGVLFHPHGEKHSSKIF